MFTWWASTKIVQAFMIHEKNMVARGRGLFSIYICIENFKNLLVRKTLDWFQYNLAGMFPWWASSKIAGCQLIPIILYFPIFFRIFLYFLSPPIFYFPIIWAGFLYFSPKMPPVLICITLVVFLLPLDIFICSLQHFFFFFFFLSSKASPPCRSATMAYPCGHFDDECAKLQIKKSIHMDDERESCCRILAVVELVWIFGSESELELFLETHLMIFIHQDLWYGKLVPNSHQRCKPSHTILCTFRRGNNRIWKGIPISNCLREEWALVNVSLELVNSPSSFSWETPILVFPVFQEHSQFQSSNC